MGPRELTVLIPTFNRAEALESTLACLAFSDYRNFSILVSDQGDEPLVSVRPVIALAEFLEHRGIPITIERHVPRRGLAEQRQFLLDASVGPYVLFLDDDVLLEEYAVGNLVRAVKEEGCGFVGAGLVALPHENVRRPEEERLEFWDGRVTPERVEPESPEWQRWRLHNAANLLHVARKLHASPEHPMKYKIAWIGGCVLYDAEKLRASGAFNFWQKLPAEHVGEDVYAQLRVMEKFGGCGLIPGGAFHQLVPTTMPDRTINAPRYLKDTSR